MKEQDLIDLGFKKEFGDDFYYYVYDFTNGFSLITNANDELLDNKWYVEIFNTKDQIRFTNKQDVNDLILLINSNKIK
jgi:hypothetical protein